ncbi:MAG: pectate lyase [Spirochaetaceae bacterium]|nr:pectate lyase [Spirochaetaceae bacterium]
MKKIVHVLISIFCLLTLFACPHANNQQVCSDPSYTPDSSGDVITDNPAWDSVNSSDTITILEAQGHLESAYIKWTGVKDAVGYNVYYKEQSASEFTKIDDMLVRLYPTYLRADAVGLKAGSYTLKIVPVFASGESTDIATANVTVAAHDRSGFAFTGTQTPGAYNSDGTLKENAKVIYVTKNNAKTVSFTNGGVTGVGLQGILGESNCKKYTDPICVRILGTITINDVDSSSKGWSSSEGLQIKGNKSPITIEGIGEDASVWGFGLMARNSQYVELKNLAVMCFMDDGISLDTDNKYTWVHNMDIFYGATGGDADQAKGDGSLDVKGDSQYQTYSYNHFWDSGKASLCGMKSETGPNYITYHHNWFDHSDSRHPRVRTMTVHVYNNYYDGNSKYGIGATTGADIFAEGNYFRNCKFPMMSSLQGNDVYAGTDTYKPGDYGTFSGESGGSIKAYNNYIEGSSTSYWPYKNTGTAWTKGNKSIPSEIDTTVHFDAYEVAKRSDSVPSSVVAFNGADTYSNFDTVMGDVGLGLEKLPTTPEQAKTTVEKYAGRVNGGDFKWNFNDEQADTSYDVDTQLKEALVNYKTTLVKVLGEADSTDSGSTGDSTDSGNTESGTTGGSVIEGAIVHNFTESGTTSSVFTITGNTSTSKGTVTYNGETLTKCLKLESKTNISFTTTVDMTLTLVLNKDNGTNIKVDGEKLSDPSGIITVKLAAGTHTITKADTANLFYMSLVK